MVRYVCFFLILGLAGIACKEKEDVLIEKKPYVSFISNGTTNWQFEYDASYRVSKMTRTSGLTTTTSSFKYNALNEVQNSVHESYGGYTGGRYSGYKYEYDANGFMTEIWQKSKTGEYAKASVVLNESGKIRIKPPNSSEIAGNIYYMKDENVILSSCFDCPASSFQFEYFEMESILPENLRKYWRLYNPSSAGITFLNSLLKIGSFNMPKRYYILDRNLLLLAVRNNIVLDETTDLPIKVELIVDEGLDFPGDRKVGEVVNTYTIEYVYL